MSGLVVGVDGGGTQTRAVVLDMEGTEVGRARGRSAVADARHPERAAAAVADTVRAAVAVAGAEPPVRALWAALSGAGREEPRSAVELVLGRMGLAQRVRVGTDVAAAFHDAFGSGPGVLLVAGTGSIAWGRAEDGREARVGGWGHHIGDEGSGYAVGLEALKRVARHADGRAPETALRDLVRTFTGASDDNDLIQWAADATKAQVAALVPVVSRAAARGDEVAADILDHAAHELEGHIVTILANLGPWSRPPGVALTGGLIQPGGPLRPALEGVLAHHRLEALARPLDAARGAARLAMELSEQTG